MTCRGSLFSSVGKVLNVFVSFPDCERDPGTLRGGSCGPRADGELQRPSGELAQSLQIWHFKAGRGSDVCGFMCRPFRYDATESVLCHQETQQQRDLAEQNYTNYKEIIWKLQHQLDESRRKIQEYQVHKGRAGLTWPTIIHSFFLFQSLIALFCSNTGGLGKASVTTEGHLWVTLAHTGAGVCSSPHLQLVWINE